MSEKKHTLLFRRWTAVVLSVVLLSPGWLGLTGFTLPFAFIPLLWLSASYDTARRSWWRVCGWSAMTFALWNVATVWWIWLATPVGPIAAILASTIVNTVAFMCYHSVRRRAPKWLAYTVLAAAWVATEYWYNFGDFSWPWLLVGNGFSHDVRAVQWYEYTGIFGGSLWVILCNILIFEALRARRSAAKWSAAVIMLFVPICISLGIWWSWEEPAGKSVKVSIIQPDVDAYAKFDGDDRKQEENILDLLQQVPSDARFILLPETAVPGYYWEPNLSEAPYSTARGAFWRELADTLHSEHPQALLIAGTSTLHQYLPGTQPHKARHEGDSYYDVFNTAVGLDSAGHIELYHKGKLVIGVENTPTLLFDLMQFLVVDLGGVVGQLGQGTRGEAFEYDGVRVGPAICYEGLYGEYFGGFARDGAQFMALISNDGWWGDTPGYKHLFTISRLRAIETRRAIARSANTGRSGFISARGDVGQTLGWNARGVLTAQVPLADTKTFYTRHGDYLGRIAQWVLLFGLLGGIFCRFRKRTK